MQGKYQEVRATKTGRGREEDEAGGRVPFENRGKGMKIKMEALNLEDANCEKDLGTMRYLLPR